MMLKRRLMSMMRTQSRDKRNCPWWSAILWIQCRIESVARLTLKTSTMMIKRSRYIRQKELNWWRITRWELTKNKKGKALREQIDWRLLSSPRKMRTSCRCRKLPNKSLIFWVSTSAWPLSKWLEQVRGILRDSRNNSNLLWEMAASSATTWGRWKTFWKSWTNPARNGRIRTWPSWCLFWKS